MFKLGHIIESIPCQYEIVVFDNLSHQRYNKSRQDLLQCDDALEIPIHRIRVLENKNIIIIEGVER